MSILLEHIAKKGLIVEIKSLRKGGKEVKITVCSKTNKIPLIDGIYTSKNTNLIQLLRDVDIIVDNY